MATQKYWNGSEWVTPKMKIWDGNQWANMGVAADTVYSMAMLGIPLIPGVEGRFKTITGALGSDETLYAPDGKCWYVLDFACDKGRPRYGGAGFVNLTDFTGRHETSSGLLIGDVNSGIYLENEDTVSFNYQLNVYEIDTIIKSIEGSIDLGDTGYLALQFIPSDTDEAGALYFSGYLAYRCSARGESEDGAHQKVKVPIPVTGAINAYKATFILMKVPGTVFRGVAAFREDSVTTLFTVPPNTTRVCALGSGTGSVHGYNCMVGTDGVINTTTNYRGTSGFDIKVLHSGQEMKVNATNSVSHDVPYCYYDYPSVL